VVLRNLLRTIRKGWRLVAICTLAAWMISLLISYSTTPQYRSVATFLIYPNPNLVSSRDVVTSLDTLSGSTVSKTYLEIFNSTRVYKDTIQRLELDPALMDTYKVSASVTPGSNIALSVSGPDPEVAAFLANNIGQNGINYIKGIYQVFEIAFLDQASIPATPFIPNTFENGGIAAGIGLLVGILVAALKEIVRIPLETLRERALIDRTSSAFTLRQFRRLLEREMARAPAAPISLALIDLEGLGDLVGTLPEAVLTSLLRGVTSILRNQLRGNDIIGRWDKTIFALMLPSTPAAPATRTLERIMSALADPLMVETTGDQISLAPVVGLASRVDEEAPTTLVEHAQAALEKARDLDRKMVAYPESKN
jgi:diguanylate cyclase (GGDEF)-like protein